MDGSDFKLHASCPLKQLLRRQKCGTVLIVTNKSVANICVVTEQPNGSIGTAEGTSSPASAAKELGLVVLVPLIHK
jgi:hypothetical protein